MKLDGFFSQHRQQQQQKPIMRSEINVENAVETIGSPFLPIFLSLVQKATHIYVENFCGTKNLRILCSTKCHTCMTSRFGCSLEEKK